MEVAHYYTERYRRAMDRLGVLSPSIEPCASGHIIEQIQMIERILADGYAYVVNGSVYFDVERYNRDFRYGILSGRNLEDIVANTRELDGQSEKTAIPMISPCGKRRRRAHHALALALERRVPRVAHGVLGHEHQVPGRAVRHPRRRHGPDVPAPRVRDRPVHGRPRPRLGQLLGAQQHDYHQRAEDGQVAGQFHHLEELFTGSHRLLAQAYSPMTIRFFVLQAHYRSTLDFSNEALQAAEKGLDRLMKGVETLGKLRPSAASTVDPAELERPLREAMDDDLNSPMVISALFDWVRTINQLAEGQQHISEEDLERLRATVHRYVFDILGLRDEKGGRCRHRPGLRDPAGGDAARDAPAGQGR